MERPIDSSRYCHSCFVMSDERIWNKIYDDHVFVRFA